MIVSEGCLKGRHRSNDNFRNKKISLFFISCTFTWSLLPVVI